MKNILCLMAGLALMVSAVGCCCTSGCQPYYGGGGGCPTCPPAGGPVYQGASYPGYNAAPVAAAPTYYPTYQSTAMAPIESLPTY